MTPALEVLTPGPLTLIQDRGRPGMAAIGVPHSGAADRGSFRLSARLLAQTDAYAALEVTLGGLAVRARGELVIALTGAVAPATIAGRGVGYASPFALRDGETLTLGRPIAGLRSYLSVRGGIDVAPVLGSRSTDVLSGLGPKPLAAGDLLPVGPPPAAFPRVDVAPIDPPEPGPLTLHATWGPRADWLADPEKLTEMSWTVSSRSDRVGIRLEGAPIDRHPAKRGTELASEGVVRGALQVPPGGQPVLFLADHPVTGGYPVVAVLRGADVDRAAQAVPGQIVHIRVTD